MLLLEEMSNVATFNLRNALIFSMGNLIWSNLGYISCMSFKIETRKHLACNSTIQLILVNVNNSFNVEF